MKKHNLHIFFQTIITIFLAAYLLGSFTNLLCSPHHVPGGSKTSIAGDPAYNQMPNTDLTNTNYLQAFERYTFDNDAVNELTFAPKSIDLGFGFSNIPFEINTIHPPPTYLYNCQCAYLSFCTFRI